MRKKDSSHDRLIRQRIRNRREARGMASYELAEAAGISPSYLSLIESGSKLPSEEIAVRIAKALDDDVDLYRAWVQASRYPDFDKHIQRLLRLERVGSTPESRARVRSGGRIEEEEVRGKSLGGRFAKSRPGSASARMKRWFRSAEHKDDTALGEGVMEESVADMAMVEPSAAADGAMDWLSLDASDAPTVEVPLLADGADPGDDPGDADDVIEWFQLDSRFLPPGIERPFAYRPDEAAVERVRGLIRPGDLVVLAARPPSVGSAGIYAIRHEGRVVLSRVVQHGPVLLLLPSDDAGSPVPIESRDEQQLLDRLAGVVVTTIRSWGSPAPAMPSPYRPKPRGYSVRLEGDFLVRDCHWKARYGWRPIQRPEDLDYLEAHPGTKIRFQLIKDGRVRFLLEMSPEEWRGALGDYVDGPTWTRNGYIVAITRRREGEYTMEFQDRWAGFVREARD